MQNLWTILFLTATVYSVYYSRKLKETVKDKSSELTSNEILHVVVPEIFSPIIAGAVYFYGWRKDMPRRASQANKYSWIIFGTIGFFGVIWKFLTVDYYK